MSSASWTMPRPRSQNQTRLTAARANQGFFGDTSHDANASRGSSVAVRRTAVPSGSTDPFVPLSGSKKTISSFHSAVAL